MSRGPRHERGTTLGRAIVVTMISLTDDGSDRVPLSVGQAHQGVGRPARLPSGRFRDLAKFMNLWPS